MALSKFAIETDRKEKLLTALEQHEKEIRFKTQDKTLKYGFYDRIFNGVAEVTKVGKSSLRLQREDGRPLGVLIVTSDIALLSRREDHLLGTLGFRCGQWHLIQVQMVGSFVGDGNGEKQMHLSVSSKNLAEGSPYANI